MLASRSDHGKWARSHLCELIPASRASHMGSLDGSWQLHSRPPWRFLKRHAWGLWKPSWGIDELGQHSDLNLFIIWRIVDMINAPVRIHHGVVVISLCFKCSESLRRHWDGGDLKLIWTCLRPNSLSLTILAPMIVSNHIFLGSWTFPNEFRRLVAGPNMFHWGL